MEYVGRAGTEEGEEIPGDGGGRVVESGSITAAAGATGSAGMSGTAGAAGSVGTDEVAASGGSNPEAGFKRSTETFQGAPFLERVKTLDPAAKTRNGPVYGRVSGGFTASTRTKTCVTPWRGAGTAEEGPAAEAF